MNFVFFLNRLTSASRNLGFKNWSSQNWSRESGAPRATSSPFTTSRALAELERFIRRTFWNTGRGAKLGHPPRLLQKLGPQLAQPPLLCAAHGRPADPDPSPQRPGGLRRLTAGRADRPALWKSSRASLPRGPAAPPRAVAWSSRATRRLPADGVLGPHLSALPKASATSPRAAPDTCRRAKRS